MIYELDKKKLLSFFSRTRERDEGRGTKRDFEARPARHAPKAARRGGSAGGEQKETRDTRRGRRTDKRKGWRCDRMRRKEEEKWEWERERVDERRAEERRAGRTRRAL